jgi:hypothetical protein
MANIYIIGSIDISINGQSYGLTCDWGYNIACCSKPGTYTVFYLNGGISICQPGDEELCGLNNNYPSVQYTQVFCDPCLNRCNKDGNTLKYNGDQQWLFTTYVNNAPEPRPLVLTTFSASTPYPKCDGSGKISVGDVELCCNSNENAQIFIEPTIVELKSLLSAYQQPYIPFGGDPSEACNCGCPFGEAGCGPIVDACSGLSEIISAMRSVESTRCVVAGNNIIP